MPQTLVLYSSTWNVDFGTGSDNLTHGAILAPEFEFKESTHTIPGVIGEERQASPPNGRTLTLSVTVCNFTDLEDLRYHVATIQSHMNKSGKLFEKGVIWPKCTFRGFRPTAPPFHDGSGQHGWVQYGSFSFRQNAF